MRTTAGAGRGNGSFSSDSSSDASGRSSFGSGEAGADLEKHGERIY